MNPDMDVVEETSLVVNNTANDNYYLNNNEDKNFSVYKFN